MQGLTRHRTLPVHGADLYLEEFGEGPPLILLHGGLGSGAEWAPLIPALAERFHVIVPDSRGHGRSTNPAGQLSYPALADDLDVLISTLALRLPLVAGWSDGGQVALELAVRHPGTAGQLVVGGAYPDFSSSGLRDIHRAILGADLAGVPDLAHLERDLGEEADAIKGLHPGGGQRWATLIEQTASLWLDYDGISSDQVSDISVPVLVLAGDRDEILPLDLSTSLYRMLRRSELAVVANADHGSPFTLERGPTFAAAICDFATRHVPIDQTMPADEE